MLTSILSTPLAFAEGGITSLAELKSAFNGTFTGNYVLESDINVTNSGITSSITIDGNGHILNSTETGGDSTIYQNENVTSELKNLTINGNTKPEVGIWEGAGSMTITDSVIQNYAVSTVRRAAIGAGSSGSGKQGSLTLNNVDFINNSDFDINISDAATVNINEGTELNKVRLQSTGATLNIGANWDGEFEITMDSPASRTLGTVGEGADISGITVSGDAGYYAANEDGKLVIKNDNGATIRFDMNSRSTLFKGSAGFLYGVAEINVPSIDLLQGLKPSTMVQKALGGLQHPTGDATRVSSALEAAGVRDMQVYLQDIYLEWPYNAPYKADGSLDVDGYQRTAESILYGMICHKANEGDKGAFLGSDGNYYTLNEEEAAKYSYVLYNEPDQIWYGGNLDGLKKAWKQLYDAVHAIDPNARCAGPNFAGFNASKYDSFLSYCYDNNCLPELISWHELGDSSLTSFFNNYASIESMVKKYYTDAYAQKSGRSYQPELLVNEYARHYDIGAPGGLVKWLSMFEDKDMNACMAYWGMANSLNEMAADHNSPASTWWVYHWYAQMTGEQCTLTSPSFENTRFYGTAAYDKDINMAYVLFGGNEEKHSKETVLLDNMNSTALAGKNSAANVKIYGVSFSGQLGSKYQPEIVFDGPITVNDNTLKIQVTDTDEMDAFFAVITPTDEAGTTMQDVRISTLSYEAEDADLIGGATAYNKVGWSTFAASGRKEVGSINNNGDGVKFTVNVPESGMYDLGIFYSLQAPYVNAQTLEPDANGQNRAIGKTLPFGMQIDNEVMQTLYLESTVVWHYRRHHNVDVYLDAGEHTITFTQINGDEGSKGNLQLVAALDKIDLDLIEDYEGRYDFEVDITEHTAFKEGDVTKITAVAPVAGYYTINGAEDATLSRQLVDYAPDAKTYSECSTYDHVFWNGVTSDGCVVISAPTVYLSQGANTIGVKGDASVLRFEYNDTPETGATIDAFWLGLDGYNAYTKENEYARSGKVLTNLGVGQYASADENGEDEYVTFHVDAPVGGMYNFAIRYANDEPAPVMRKTDGSTYVHPYNIDLVERYMQIKVGDNEPETVYFRNTFSWETFRTVDVVLKLETGYNTIKLYNDNSYQFSELVNSTAPEIDQITVTYLDEIRDVGYTSGQLISDTTKLDETVREAQKKLSDTDSYSADSLANLQSVLNSIDSSSQNTTNYSYTMLKAALASLKPAALNLKDYYVTSYASTNVGVPENSYDGNVSTVWTADRGAAPYVAYQVFYAGDGNVFKLDEITMQGDSNAKVIYLGTNSDDILKDPSIMNPNNSDLCKKDSELYKPFAQLYSADILGTASGTNAVTQLNGEYRYLIVGVHTWSITNVKEISLSAVVEDTDGANAVISMVPDTDKMCAEFDIKYNNTGEVLHAYIAAYNADGSLISAVSSDISGNFLSLELDKAPDTAYTYKAFLWNSKQEPVCNAVVKN